MEHANRSGSLNQTAQDGGGHFNTHSYDIMVVSFFSAILLTGLVGNLMVLATIFKWPKLRNSCGLLIANISVADLGVALFAAPQRIAERYIRGWPLGEVLCKLITPLQDLMVCVSVVTHSTIAMERYRATVTPFKPKLGVSKTRIVVLAIWCLCYIFGCLPLAIPLQVQSIKGALWCFPQWSLSYRRTYQIYLVMVFIAAQLIIQSFAYISIIRIVNKKNDIISIVASKTENIIPGRSFDSRASCAGSVARERRKEKLVKMLLVLVTVFQICHLPRGITMLIREFMFSASLRPSFEYIDLIALALYYLKHVINPFILYGMSADFRQGCLEVFSTICCCSADAKANDHNPATQSLALKKARQIGEEADEDELENPV